MNKRLPAPAAPAQASRRRQRKVAARLPACLPACLQTGAQPQDLAYAGAVGDMLMGGLCLWRGFK